MLFRSKEDTAMSLTIEADMLASGINRTVFATADDELRPVMNGIFFDITADDLTFVASDGHKLVRVTTTEAKGEGRSSFILPKKPANLLKSLLPKETGIVTINFDENNAYITMSAYKMICRFVSRPSARHCARNTSPTGAAARSTCSKTRTSTTATAASRSCRRKSPEPSRT